MQTVYATELLEGSIEDKLNLGNKLLRDKLHKTLDIFTLAAAYLTHVAQYAKTEAANRSKKYLATEQDKNVSTKLAGNDWVERFLTNNSFTAKANKMYEQEVLDKDWIKKLFQEFAEQPTYIQYTAQSFRQPQEEKQIIQQLWKFIVSHEKFSTYLVEEVNGWDEDKEQTEMLMENLLYNNAKINFNVPLSAEKQQYANELLVATIEKEEVCMQLIKPKLQNWDSERVAQIDLILLRMGVCELLFFPTIPTKVIINEYIEVAKLYSTPQSGQFINGVLDNIQKELHQSGKIKKQERYQK